MYRFTHLVILSLLLLSNTNLFSQTEPNDFLIDSRSEKVRNYEYNKIDFVDSRNDIDKDAGSYGLVKVGGFNKPVLITTSLEKQLTTVIQSLTDTSAKKGELLFQLRQLYFGRLARAFSDGGFYYLKAALYAKNVSGNYQRLDSIDTVITVKSANITPALFKNAGETFTNFIAKNLSNISPEPISYTFTDIMYIEESEKARIPVYTTKTFSEGLYLTYNSFKNQRPDKQVVVEMKEDKIKTVKEREASGEEIKWKSKDVYAIVYQGQAYIATNTGFYLLHKNQNDFYFTGKIKISAPAAEYVAVGMLFGLLGVLTIPSDEEAVYYMKLNHLNGGFIKIQKFSE